MLLLKQVPDTEKVYFKLLLLQQFLKKEGDVKTKLNPFLKHTILETFSTGPKMMVLKNTSSKGVLGLVVSREGQPLAADPTPAPPYSSAVELSTLPF